MFLLKVAEKGVGDDKAAEYKEEVNGYPSVTDQRDIGHVAEDHQMKYCDDSGSEPAPDVQRLETDSGCIFPHARLGGKAICRR
jgi:hypothetical protein